MVRKVRKKTFERLMDEIKALRAVNRNLIAVSNSEWYSLFRDEIRNSIAIEGVFANRSDLINVLEKNKKADSQKMASILGYFEAAGSMYEYAHTQYCENEFMLRISDIKQIHTMLMRYEKERGHYIGDIGEFRKTNVKVLNAKFTSTDVYFVRPAIELFVKWFNRQYNRKTLDPLTLAAISHIWFETIHPFRDGNGRVGRILLSYILIGCGLLNITIKGVSQKDRDSYYHALEQNDAPCEKIHKLLEQGSALTLKEVDARLKQNEFSLFCSMIEKALNEAISRLKRGAQEMALSDAVVPLRELARLFNYSQDYLRNLINRGSLKGQRKGKLWYVRVRDMQAYLDRK